MTRGTDLTKGVVKLVGNVFTVLVIIISILINCSKLHSYRTRDIGRYS